MRNLRLEKKGLRGLAIAESFRSGSEKSLLAGIVMRRDFLIDGFTFGRTTVEGDDATENILNMFDDLNRPDISYVLISGIIISMYNIIDLKKVYQHTKIPVIGVTYEESQGIEDSIKFHFQDSSAKLRQYEKLGGVERINLSTSYAVFVRRAGCSYSDVKRLLNGLTLQGAVPEPVRVAQLLANSANRYF